LSKHNRRERKKGYKHTKRTRQPMTHPELLESIIEIPACDSVTISGIP
jgi:hypothetical protein